MSVIEEAPPQPAHQDLSAGARVGLWRIARNATVAMMSAPVCTRAVLSSLGLALACNHAAKGVDSTGASSKVEPVASSSHMQREDTDAGTPSLAPSIQPTSDVVMSTTKSADAGVVGPESLGEDAGSDELSTEGSGYFDGRSRLDGLPEVGCDIAVTSSELSPNIPTVGIVTFTTNMPRLLRAEIHFGLDTRYGLVAPVDLNNEGSRTLLLGMQQTRTYHYRVVVSDGKSACYGKDATLETGSLNVSGLAESSTGEAAAPGFIVTSRDGHAVIFDKEGELVWAYEMWNVFSVQMSWDGKYMIGRDPGPFDLATGGTFFRVSMDGSEFSTLDVPGGDHHDFTAIPEGIAYLAKTNEGECDRVYEASLELVDGKPIFDTWQIYQYFPDEGLVEGTEICHANRIHYLLDKNVYTVSDRNKDAIAIFKKDGTPVTSIGKPPVGNWTRHIVASGAGPGGDWHVQHGHHWYADDKLVLFTNESKEGAAMVHYTINGSQATLDWKYSGAGASRIQGDVQRLPNGNFLVTANLSSTIVEVSRDGQTEVGRYVLDGPIGPLYGFTYSRHRASLYGAPSSR